MIKRTLYNICPLPKEKVESQGGFQSCSNLRNWLVRPKRAIIINRRKQSKLQKRSNRAAREHLIFFVMPIVYSLLIVYTLKKVY